MSRKKNYNGSINSKLGEWVESDCGAAFSVHCAAYPFLERAGNLPLFSGSLCRARGATYSFLGERQPMDLQGKGTDAWPRATRSREGISLHGKPPEPVLYSGPDGCP